jgi:glycosyltransferase involved in cell wall biosynthesis
MKILNVIQCANLGGMEQANLLRLIGLRELGHECHLVSLNPIGELGPALELHQIPHEGIPYRGRWGWRSVPLVFRKLRSLPADGLLMTGHHLLTMLTIGDVCRQARVLDLHSDHGATAAKSAAAWRLIYRLAVKKFRAITFPSDFVRKEAESIYPPVARLSHTLRNPFQLPPPAESADRIAARELLGLPLGVPIIANAGWQIPRKRFDVFLRVAQLVHRRLPDSVFLIAGGGSEHQRLKALAEDLGIRSRIHWLGWQRDMKSFFHAIDVLLFNSDWDAMPRIPLEALSYGVPVVASVIHSGLGEFLENERHGVLLPKHDIEALAESVVWSIEHGSQSRARSQAGRERLAQLGSVADNARKMEDLLFGGVRSRAVN